MKKITVLSVLIVIFGLPYLSVAQSRRDAFDFGHRSELVGEISFFNIKAEYGKTQVAKISAIGLGHYFGNYGIGAYLFRYTNVLDATKGYAVEYEMSELIPIQISYVAHFVPGSYKGKSYRSENEPLLFWNSVTPGQYAKFYVRLFGEASFLKFLSCLRNPAYFVSPDGSVTNKYRTIGEMYPPTLTAGMQVSYTILSLEAGYIYQTKRWYEFYKHGLMYNPNGFSFTGPYISANITLGGILIRTGI